MRAATVQAAQREHWTIERPPNIFGEN